MQKITDTCQPRQDILTGTFNPEIFTASLAEVIRFYQENRQGIHPVYTDAIQFFSEGTYATDGFKMVLNEVFARLAGDHTAPAIHRLETAFGGGKTHTLIACTHIGYKGDELTPHIRDLDRHADGKQEMIRALLAVWAAEVPDESLKKEARAIIFGLQ